MSMSSNSRSDLHSQVEGYDYKRDQKIQQRNRLITQAETYENVIKKLETVDGLTLVSLGAGYFVELEVSQAKDFLNRNLSRVREAIVILTREIYNAKDMEDIEDPIISDHTEDSQFVEIREELDQNDEIVGVKLNNEKFDITSTINSHSKLSEDVPFSKQNFSQPISSNKEKVKDLNTPLNDEYYGSSDHTNKSNDSSSQIAEMLNDLEIVENPSISNDNVERYAPLLKSIDNLNISNEEKQILRNSCVGLVEDTNECPEDIAAVSKDKFEVANSTPTRQISHELSKESLQITADEILQLELIDGEETDHPQYSDNEEWDYDFGDEMPDIGGVSETADLSTTYHTLNNDYAEDEDLDDDNEDQADDILYGNHKENFFNLKGNAFVGEDINHLLWEQIKKIRLKGTAVKDSPSLDKVSTEFEDNQKPSSKRQQSVSSNKKKVRFSDSLDIKEIQNVSEELKQIDHKDSRLSKFKQARMLRNSSNVIHPVEEIESITDSPLSDVVENSFIDSPTPLVHETYKATSTVTANSLDPRENVKEAQNKEAYQETHKSKEKNNSRQSNKQPFPIGTTISSEKAFTDSSKYNQDPRLFETSDDMDLMAMQYVQGRYDEDIEARGPLVDKLDDFEVLNRLVESMPQHHSATISETSYVNSIEDDLKTDSIVPEVDSSDDEPVLKDYIAENDFDLPGENSSEETDYGSFSTDYDTLQSEVSSDYQKLKQKLFFDKKSKSEGQEIEPLDEKGEPVRISRFKSRRAGLN